MTRSAATLLALGLIVAVLVCATVGLLPPVEGEVWR